MPASAFEHKAFPRLLAGASRHLVHRRRDRLALLIVLSLLAVLSPNTVFRCLIALTIRAWTMIQANAGRRSAA